MAGAAARPEPAGRVEISFAARLVPKEYETAVKGHAHVCKLLRPRDASSGAGQPVGNLMLRFKTWDGTRDDDLDNVLWHDVDPELLGGRPLDDPHRQSASVLAAFAT